MNERAKLYPTLSRTSPVLFFIIILLNCIIYPSYESFYLLIAYNISTGSNFIIKHYFAEPIYHLLNVKTLPILGSGERPLKANSCSFILDNSKSTSYGMPSGHTQIAWTLCTYFFLKIINNWYKKTHTYKDNKITTIFEYIWFIISCILILGTAIYISYSRVYIEGCHTIQQVTIGGLIGILSGFIIYYFENDAINLLSKIYKFI